MLFDRGSLTPESQRCGLLVVPKTDPGSAAKLGDDGAGLAGGIRLPKPYDRRSTYAESDGKGWFSPCAAEVRGGGGTLLGSKAGGAGS
jgi:hypothetical protein